MTQFSAYINAYEFIKMTDQLMLVDLSKVVQVQKDDFICEPHEFILLPYMRDKTHELFKTNDHGVSKLARKLEWNTERTYETDDEERPCYLSGLWQNDGVGTNPVFAKVEKAFGIHRERFAHIDDMAILPHPVISLEGPGGTGKTDYLLWAMKLGLLHRCVYIAQSHKLGRAKADEYKLIFSEDCDLDSITQEFRDIAAGKKTVLMHREQKTLQITVWARAEHESPEIWGLIHRYANVLIFDEVSMMYCETCKFLMERFAQHKIYFCGDPGFQLAAYKTNRDGDAERTPYNAKTIGIPSYAFSKIFRVKDERLMSIRLEGRAMLEKGTTPMSHEEYRRLHAGTTFPAEWGRQQNGKPGPVAGMMFIQAETNESYVEKVAMNCESTRGFMHTFRRFVDRKFHYEQPISVEEIEAFYMDKFSTVDSMEEAVSMYQAWEEENGKFVPKDMIICSTNEFADEWTKYLTPLQPSVTVTKDVTYKQGKLHEYFKDALMERNEIERKLNAAYAKYITASDSQRGDAHKKYRHYKELSEKIKAGNETVQRFTSEVQLQKWKMLSTTRDFSNGQIVISEKPPMDKCVLTHAFTAHSTIGETARGKVFIDRRNMFEIEHWETIIGRAKRWEDIVIVNLPDPAPADKYANTKMYCISSKKGKCCYIGFTTLPTVEERGQKHWDDYKTKTNKQCMSRLVLKFKDWQIDLIEEFPCASKRQAEAREMYHINRAENCVNKNTATDKSLPTCAITKRKAVVPDAQKEPIVVEEDPSTALRLDVEERLKIEAEAEDNEIAAEIAHNVHEEQRKRKAEEAIDDRFDENGNFKSYSFQLPVKQQKAKPKMNFSWMKK
jgi:hypothetical protein